MEAEKTVSTYEWLKIQIDNLELIEQYHQNGQDMSLLSYNQMEVIYNTLEQFEKRYGGDKVRERYKVLVL